MEGEQPKDRKLAGIDVRYTEPGDAKFLKQWLMETRMMKWKWMML
jgi:hypothetical protein